MDKYIVAPPNGSTQNSVGAADRKWKEGHFEKLPNWQEYLAESTGYGIVSGCEPSISGLTVTVGAGIVHLADGTRKELPATNITLDAADSTNPRIDLVYVTSTGEVAKITGTAAASPSAPSVPTGGISVAQVSVAANATAGTLNDVRGMLPRWYNSGVVNPMSYGAKGDGVEDDTIPLQKAFNALDSKPGYILDLAGRDYVISSPIIIPKIWWVTIQNGTIRAANNFVGNYLIIGQGDFPTITTPGTNYGVIDNVNLFHVNLDCNLKCGGLSLTGFLKFKIDGCEIWNYINNGIITTRKNAHELIVSNTFLFTAAYDAQGVAAINISNNDNIFSNLVIEGGTYGIVLNNSQSNIFSNIHIYHVYSYNGFMLQGTSNHNQITSIYFDGCAVYSNTPGNIIFTDCYFLEPKRDLLTIDYTGAQILSNIRFINCDILRTTSTDTTIKMVNLTNSNAKIYNSNILDFNINDATGEIEDNRNLIAIVPSYNVNNLWSVDSDDKKYETTQSCNRLMAYPSGAYTVSVKNNKVYIDNYNTSGYRWYGYELTEMLEKGKTYAIKNLVTNSCENIIIGTTDDYATQEKEQDITKIAVGLIPGQGPEWLRFTFDNDFAHIFVFSFNKELAPIIYELKE